MPKRYCEFYLLTAAPIFLCSLWLRGPMKAGWSLSKAKHGFPLVLSRLAHEKAMLFGC